MFTTATKNFGIWRSTHPIQARHAGKPTFGILVALGICAFVGWLVFFLALKIRGDFFLLETADLSLARLSAKKTEGLFDNRRAAVGMGLKKLESGKIQMLFDSGETFLFPDQNSDVLAFLQERTNNMELLSMLTLTRDPAMARVQLWPDSRLTFDELNGVVETFSRFGFDDFDVAFEVERE